MSNGSLVRPIQHIYERSVTESTGDDVGEEPTRLAITRQRGFAYLSSVFPSRRDATYMKIAPITAR
jgi:hypothetical protein